MQLRSLTKKGKKMARRMARRLPEPIKPAWLSVLFMVLLLPPLPLLYIYLPNVEPDNIRGVIETVVLYLTYIALLVYAMETSRLRLSTDRHALESQKQTYFATQPFLIIYLDHAARIAPSRSISIKNSGAGVAVDVKMEVHSNQKKIFKENVDILVSNEYKLIFDSLTINGENEIVSDNPSDRFGSIARVEITYRDITGVDHREVYAYDEETDGLRLASTKLPKDFRNKTSMYESHTLKIASVVQVSDTIKTTLKDD